MARLILVFLAAVTVAAAQTPPVPANQLAVSGNACGPTALVLQLSGHQSALLRIFTIASAVGIPLVAWAAWQFGPIGAAAALALIFAVANLLPVRVAIRSLGINPTIFGWRRPG